jgi:hypothetical protein
MLIAVIGGNKYQFNYWCLFLSIGVIELNKYHFYIQPIDIDEETQTGVIEGDSQFVTVLAHNELQACKNIDQYLEQQDFNGSMCFCSDPNVPLATFKTDIEVMLNYGEIY